MIEVNKNVLIERPYCEYGFILHGMSLDTYSPVKRSMEKEDTSRDVPCGCFIGSSTIEGVEKPFNVPSVATENYIKFSLKKSHEWQMKNGYGDKNGLTPASRMQQEIEQGIRDACGDLVKKHLTIEKD